MVNEMRLIDDEVVRQLRSICDHLSQIENRSFIVLGSIPLTFGSMTSIIGWVATGNVLIQSIR